MSTKTTECKSRNFLAILLFLQVIIWAIILFDIPVIRQLVGFAYFTFFPGFIVIKLLKLDNLDGLETFLFSVGFSVAFLMLMGLFINEFSFLLGISQPLSLMPLMIILNSLILLGGVLVYLRSSNVNLWGSESFGRSPYALLFICLPILSVIGAMWVNAHGNNLILLLMMIVISALFGIGVISKKLLPPKLYPFALLMIAISLLYHSSLISNYLVSFNSDAPPEYFLAKTTENNAYWSSTPSLSWYELYGRLNAMISVTILPTVYSTLLSIDPTWIFKMLFPLIFSFVPLGLYQVWCTHVGKKYAFISTFLFMVQSTFYTEMLGLNRQMVAELFFVLLLLVILNKKMKTANRMVVFIIFSFALVTSHYALAEIFLFFISFAFILLSIRERILKKPSRNIAASMVVLFFVVMFTWYIYTSGSAVFDSFVSFGNDVYNQLGEFFNPASRGQTVLRGLGIEEVPSIWNSISRTFAYITEALIVIGFGGLILRKTKTHFEKYYFMLCSAAMGLLAALILVPGLANTLNMTRFYHILLFFLAPFCIIGAEVIVKLLFKREKELVVSLLLLIVLVPYFLFQTGFIYEVTGTQNYSLPLSKHRMNALFLRSRIGYFDECEVFGAFWMSENVDVENSKTYADITSVGNILLSYGMIYSGLDVLSNVTRLSTGDNVYLNRANVVDDVLISRAHLLNTTSISDVWMSANKIYSNGECEIYKETIGS